MSKYMYFRRSSLQRKLNMRNFTCIGLINAHYLRTQANNENLDTQNFSLYGSHTYTISMHAFSLGYVLIIVSDNLIKSLLRNLLMYVHALCPHHISFEAAGVVQAAYELFEELHFNLLPSQQQSTHSSKIKLHRLAHC